MGLYIGGKPELSFDFCDLVTADRSAYALEQ